ncbi:hypothetical protein GGS23DRAFT_435145 [Durotheca rogersii]|uniref:uncharacterized protein n=1 Tax=Durotheca rogersii TaxID=419775 RepID=UPI00221F686E|nr:uncharacterized protein GGS23DRAFT_435145 [Durotheca rogersii]KAI5865607.1 hypothetical protein GGS23DRAFT_435145 [Durotheca rogersii]
MAPAVEVLILAEQQAMASQKDSQDSQALLGKFMLEHGLGVHSSSPPVPPKSTHLSQNRASFPASAQRKAMDLSPIEEPEDAHILTRSYSSQASSAHDHRTLHENDTGFLNFNHIQQDALESALEEGDDNAADDSGATTSQPASQSHWTATREISVPETPAISREFLPQGTREENLIPPSQLFGQTQWTSAVKAVSPTSSRPSPNVFNPNSLSSNPIVSSPLKNRGLRTSPTRPLTSSPAFPRILSKPPDEKTSPGPDDDYENGNKQGSDVAETPPLRFDALRPKTVLEPISEYESFRKRSLEVAASKSPSQSGDDQDSESEADAAAYRRQLARLKREKASRTFPSISLPRPDSKKSDGVEVPSTHRTRSSQGPRKSASEQRPRYYSKYEASYVESQETVADSQEAPEPPPFAEVGPKVSNGSDEISLPDTQDPEDVNPPAPQAPMANVECQETIPETSPPGTSLGLPRLIGDILGQESSDPAGMETVSFPTLSSGVGVEQEPTAAGEPRSSSLPLSRSRPRRSGRSRYVVNSPSTIVLTSTPQRTPQSAKLDAVATPSTLPELPLPSDPDTTLSTLSVLSRTPNMPSSTTSRTDVDHIPDKDEQPSSSPIEAGVRRRGRPLSSVSRSISLPKDRTHSRSRGSLRRITRQSSMSTDELANSPLSTSGNENEVRNPTTSKPVRRSFANQHRLRESAIKAGIFEGMVFALSFQNEQPRKGQGKHVDRSALERMIRREGGRVLSGGFDELFKFDSFQATGSTSAAHSLSSSLELLNRDTGFTALIADGHSRKVKYMQALALGIPCLAPRWITTCIAKQEIVDWTSYLLCAGASALLGDAIRSRSLQAYDASTARLADAIDARPRLLHEARILLVMGNSKNAEKRLPYVFLAQILGGSLERVRTLEEARAKLRETESQDQPFDWVYVDDLLRDAEKALFGPGTPDPAISRKRKRRATGGPPHPPPKKIRTLNDELVIQSLISGRLIEDGEMEM